MASQNAIDIAASLAVLRNFRVSDAKIVSWAGAVELGATRYKMTYGLLRAVIADMALDETDERNITVPGLFARARANPPAEWLASQKLLEPPEDLYFSRQIFYPEGAEPGTTSLERAKLDQTYAGWRNSETARAWTKAQRAAISRSDRAWRDEKKKRKKLGADFNRGGEGPMRSERGFDPDLPF